jgi:AcrR family transcriptional regulator
MTIEAVAQSAGVGKPAIYRRSSDKAGLVAYVISRQLFSG